MSNEARMPVNNLPKFEPLIISGDGCVLDEQGHCITCSDEALPARVLRIDQELGTALVEINDTTEEIDITLVEEVVPGDWLLVHGGVAIANVDGEETHSPGEER